MSTRLLWIGCVVVASCNTVACADDEGESAGAGGSGGSGGSGGGGGSGGSSADAGNTVSVSGIARDWLQSDPFAAPPLAGVEVCLHDHAEVPCATSGADGAWKLDGVPAASEVLVSFKKTGFLPLLRAIKTTSFNMVLQAFEGTLVTTAGLSDLLPGFTTDTTKGGIAFFMNVPGTRFVGAFDWLRGYRVTASPSSGDGPLYLDEAEVLDPTATSSAGGFGVYVNMSSGVYTLTFQPPAAVTCTTWPSIGLPDAYGFPTSDPLTIRVPVVEGFTTGPVGIFCPTVSDGGVADGGISDSGSTD